MIQKILEVLIFADSVCNQHQIFFCLFQAVLLGSDLIDSTSVLFCKDYVLIHNYLPALRASSLAMLSAISRSFVSGVIFLLMILAAISQESPAT